MASVRRLSVQNSRRRNEENENELILKRLESLKRAHQRLQAMQDMRINLTSNSRRHSTRHSSGLSSNAGERSGSGSHGRNRSRSPLNRSAESERVNDVLHQMDWLEEYLKTSAVDPTRSNNVVDYLHATAIGNRRLQNAVFNRDTGMRQMIQRLQFRERVSDLEQINKVFCSQWLNNHEVIIGTKCNTVSVH